MTTVYAIGATALIGGGEGALDAVYVDASEDDPGIHDKDVAFALVQGDAVYHYIADADSGLDEDSPNVIKPDWQSSGVVYTGDLRWILHKCYPYKATGTNTGDIIRWNASSQEWESCAEPFELKQINLTPMENAMEDTEGGMYYKSTDKTIYVCTEGE